MNRGKLAWMCVLAWAWAGMVGCASGPAGTAESQSSAIDGHAPVPPAVVLITADDYDTVFDAAVRELRDCGFRVARNDRRFGVVTTYPQESPTAFEPWVGHNLDGELARQSTLNHLRRLVEVKIEPADGAVAEVGADYYLTVSVSLERRQQPNRYLTHSARPRVSANYRVVPAHLARRGIPSSYWEPAGDDPVLAARLLEKISERAGTTTEFYDDDE